MLNPKQFVKKIGAKRSALKTLHSEAGWSGYHTGLGQGSHTLDRQGDVFGNNAGGPFSMPNHQDRLASATSAARNAGVSNRKINKVVSKTHAIGFSEGQRDLIKTNPFG